MIRTKKPEEIELLAEGGALLSDILDELEERVVVGAKGVEIDGYARKRMGDGGVIPSFLGYRGKGHRPYPAAVCISVNDTVVHGIPNDVPFQDGDVVGIDAGCIYKRLYVDSARTVVVGAANKEIMRLVDVTRVSLQKGIDAAHVGHTTGHIGEAIQRYVEKHGFQVVRQLVGHGVGYDVHEPPQVPNFGTAGGGEALVEGLVIAIEPMVTIGDPTVVTAPDGWSVKTRSGMPSAHVEHTIAITAAGPRVLTVKQVK